MVWKDESAFPARIRSLREKIGVSQTEFADRMGVARATISYYENGDRIPDLQFLIKVCSETGCSPLYLLGSTDAMTDDMRDIADELEISDEAARGLFKGNRECYDFIFTNSHFDEMLDCLRDLLIGEYSWFALKSRAITRFLAHRALDGMIDDAIEVREKNATEEERKELEDAARQADEEYSRTMLKLRALREWQGDKGLADMKKLREESAKMAETDPFTRFRESLFDIRR